MSKRRNLSQLTLDGIRDNKRARNSTLDVTESNNNVNVSQKQSRAGIILRIVLKNFMCHSHFEIDFNKNTNFVIGRNGSGKSAIITALVVGLGGRAMITNRGSNIKGFIKAGKTTGSIEITLLNEGPMAYCENEYGSTITIIRTFSKDKSAYRVKGSIGIGKPITAKDVKNIIKTLGIDIDNPVCILNQDMSRNFLNSVDPKQKYKFLMEGTKLELLFQKYNDLIMKRKGTQLAKDKKQQEFDEAEEKLLKMKLKIDTAQKIQHMQIRRSELQKEVSWAKVIKYERKHEVAVENVAKATAKYNEMIENISNKTINMKNIDENIAKLESDLLKLREELTAKQQPEIALKVKENELKDELSEKRCSRQQIENVIKRKNADAVNLERDIQEAVKKQREIEDQRETQLKNIAVTKEKISQIENVIQSTDNDFRQMTAALEKRREDENKVLNEIREATFKSGKLNAELQLLTADSDNTLLVYGKETPRLIQQIEAAAQKFKKLPIGPVGRYIKLKDKRWSVAVESQITAGLLKSFLVDNSQDYNVLKDIIARVYGNQRKPQIIISKFFSHMHDISRTKTQSPAGFIPLIDVLEFSCTEVANCVIDQRSVEKLLLITDVNRAQSILSEERLVPRNCIRGVTVEGHEYHPEPNYKFYKSMMNRARFLQVSTAELIKELELEQMAVDLKKKSLEQEHQVIRKELKVLLNDRGELEIKLRKLRAALIQVKRQLETMLDTLEPNTANINTLAEELKHVQGVLETNIAKVADIDAQMQTVTVRIEECQSKRSEMKRSVSDISDRVQEAINNIFAEKDKRQKMCTAELSRKKELQAAKLRSEEAEKIALDIGATVDEYKQAATSICDRIDARAMEDIVLELNEINAKLLQQDDFNIYELAKEYESTKTTFDERNRAFSSFKENLEEIHNQEKHRRRLYHYIKEWKITQICSMFQLVLSRRKFHGQLTVDHDAKTLEIKIRPHEGKKVETSSANLSGGERSFSTIAFLHSIWQCMDSPFYLLDEFDVFMDKVNRTISMDVLIAHSENRSDSQFVFLTPQDISTVKASNKVAIHRLHDPIRNQTQG